ncbi:hypothetical protein TI04_06830 [Achromatium sp. WMS2]|nr:hypothetical protein TI04_06830 [Achromatium sp. WMS2]
MTEHKTVQKPLWGLILGLSLNVYPYTLVMANTEFCQEQSQAASAAAAKLDFSTLVQIRAQVRDPCPGNFFTYVENLMTQVAGTKAQDEFAQGRVAKANDWLAQAPTTAWYTLALQGDIAAQNREWANAARYYNIALDLNPPPDFATELAALAGQATVLSGTLVASVQRSGNGMGLYNIRGSYASIPAPIQFDFDQDTLTADGKASTERLAAYVKRRLQQQSQLVVTIVGHTDSRGSDAYNCDLSLRRAATVQRIIKGVLQNEARDLISKLTIQGQGERVPYPISSMAQPLTAEERFALDRRVEVLFTNVNYSPSTNSCVSN